MEDETMEKPVVAEEDIVKVMSVEEAVCEQLITIKEKIKNIVRPLLSVNNVPDTNFTPANSVVDSILDQVRMELKMEMALSDRNVAEKDFLEPMYREPSTLEKKLEEVAGLAEIYIKKLIEEKK